MGRCEIQTACDNEVWKTFLENFTIYQLLLLVSFKLLKYRKTVFRILKDA